MGRLLYRSHLGLNGKSAVQTHRTPPWYLTVLFIVSIHARFRVTPS
nr:MAG TPA: hypothetical protein [Caudoviricetes sp.]